MASIILGAIGTAIGGKIGGAVLGASAATIGGFVGSAAGSLIDQSISALLTPPQRIEGARLDALRITSSTEGAVIPRLYGRARLGGNIIWATDFREETRTTTSGGKGGGPRVETTEYTYFASFALGLCEGPIAGIGRIWADGKELDLSDATWRWYPGDEAQEPDVLIASRMGAASTPAYRGLAYVVFEDLALAPFGNRLPQMTFEVFRTLDEPGTLEAELRAVTLIPASGEFVYATEPVRNVVSGIEAVTENQNASTQATDIEVSLDRLLTAVPGIEMVSLVVAWFGDDLRCGEIRIRPGVEDEMRNTSVPWSVNGVERLAAYTISRNQANLPVYGGTPADFTVVQAIAAIKARGLRVTFYPFILMDVPAGNQLPNPYSDNAATSGQPALPWRGRITCSPAAGYAGTVDRTAAAATQVDSFFGTAAPGDFTVTGTTVAFTGTPTDWGLRRMILHYAHLCAAAGGVDAFLIGTEMRGLTTIRSAVSTYPAVAKFVTLAADVKAIVGSGCRVSYAADWSEYFGHQPNDGTGDVHFHLDPLWASPDVDFIGIDNYMPLSDWRDGSDHADAAIAPAVYDQTYLRGNVEGGEGWDWFYASPAAREAQTRTTIADTAYGKHWVFRYKAIRDWWQNQHYNRPGGVEASAPTAWVPRSKPIIFTEFGCPAIDRGTNQPNVFFDPKSSESFVPYFSRGWRDDAIQRAYIEATLGYWGDPANNPVSPVYGAPMIDLGDCAAWTWDARPYPTFPELANVWQDGENWRLGHWLTGRAGSAPLAVIVRDLCRRSGLPDDRIDVSGLWGAVEGYAIAAIEPARAAIEMLARHFGFDAFESGGAMRFVMRGRGPAAMVTEDDLVATREQSEHFELARAQESELPLALKWQIARSDESYDRAVVEARRTVATAARVATEAFPFVVPVEEADRRCRRALLEAWVGRETLALRLPPSLLALDPADTVTFVHDGRALDYRIVALSDRESRAVEAIRQDRAIYDIPPGIRPGSYVPRRQPPIPPTGHLMDLPWLRDDVPAHRPWVAIDATPWPGDVLVYRSATTDGWRLTETVTTRAGLGYLDTPLGPGPVGVFDRKTVIRVTMYRVSLRSVTLEEMLNGANVIAVRKPSGLWEVLQFGTMTPVEPGRFDLSLLLRGQLGSEDAMVETAPIGAPVVVLDGNVVSLPLAMDEIGTALNWRIGPASRPVADDIYVQQAFTPAGRGLVPFAPAHLRVARLNGGDLKLSWIRRDRAPGADSWTAFEIPMSEDTESYNVEIMDGSTVKRQATVGTATHVYPLAQQIADWGAALEPGDTLTFRVRQLGFLPGVWRTSTVVL